MSARRVKLSEVVSINPKTDTSSFDLQDEVAFIAMADVSEQGQVANVQSRAFDEVKKGYTCFQNGDVLLAKITPCFENGKAAQVDGIFSEIGFGSTEFHVLRPSKEIDGRFLFHLVWNVNFRRLGECRMTGSAGQKRVPTLFLDGYEINLPPLEEQKRIAAILDKADSLRRKRAQAITLADDFLRATFLDLFGDPVTNPKGWEVVELADLVEINPRADRSKINADDEVVFLPMAAVSEQGYVAFEERRPVAEVTKGFTYFERGDVLFAKITPCMENGKAAYLDSISTEYGFGSTEFHVLRPGLRVNPWFIFYLIWNDDFRLKAERSMKGAAGQKRVGADYLRSFKTHLPPKEVQDRFGVIVERVKQVLSESTFSLAEIEQLSKSLAAASFSRAR